MVCVLSLLHIKCLSQQPCILVLLTCPFPKNQGKNECQCFTVSHRWSAGKLHSKKINTKLNLNGHYCVRGSGTNSHRAGPLCSVLSHADSPKAHCHHSGDIAAATKQQRHLARRQNRAREQSTSGRILGPGRWPNQQLGERARTHRLSVENFVPCMTSVQDEDRAAAWLAGSKYRYRARIRLGYLF